LEENWRSRDSVAKHNKELREELDIAREKLPDGSERKPSASLGSKISTLERHNQELTLQLEGSKRHRESVTTEIDELREELDFAQLTSSLRGGEADFWREQYNTLNAQLHDEQSPTFTHDVGQPPGPNLLTEVASTQDQCSATRTTQVHCAAARDQIDVVREREFRTVHDHKDSTGKRPKPSSEDRHCMAVHVRVNDLNAYALLDSGCTTVSVTHDFARVAKLRVMQLENPVTLQLGTVGSRSMINFRAVSHLELGPIRDDNAYMDVINLDRYDMIIGTPFMRKHGLVLDFDKDILTIRGKAIQPLTIGQEDLLIAKRRQRSRPLVPILNRAPLTTP
jgi:hypothetical protein